MEAFSLWPITVYRYGIMYLIWFIVWYLFLYYIGKKWYAKQRSSVHTVLTRHLDDLIIAIVIGVLIGGRLGEIFIYNLPYYISNPTKIFYVREWWMSFIGWIIWVIIAVNIFFKIKKIAKNSYFRLLDHIVTIVPFGIMVWRIGNFLNRELYGIVTYNKALLSSIQNNSWFDYTREALLVRWDIYLRMEKIWLIFDYNTSVQFTNEMRLNTNFLASFGEGFLLLIIMQLCYWFVYKKGTKKAWRLSAIFILWYSTIRFLLEFFRQDSQFELILWLSYSQWWFVWFSILGLILLLRKQK